MTPEHRSRSALTTLAVAQVVAWGTLYYAVLVAAPAIAQDTGWNVETVFVAITAGLVASAVCALPVGRWLDRRPRRVMLTGAVVGSIAMLAAAASPTVWLFAAAWIMCGVAQSAVLYQAAFTVITHRYGAARRGPLTLVTLAGGLASTVFAPLTGLLVLELGWRLAFTALAAILALVVVPACALTVERSWAHLDPQAMGEAADTQVLRSARFWAVTLSFALMSFSLYAVTLSAVPASVEKGLGLQSASWVLGLVGTGQVLGRLVYLAVPHRGAAWLAPASVGMLGSVALVLFSVASSPFAIYAVAVITGAIRGALTLVQASAVADRWGVASYGRLNGVLAAPVIALTAFAPAAAVVLAAAIGTYSSAALVMALLCAVGGALAIRR